MSLGFYCFEQVGIDVVFGVIAIVAFFVCIICDTIEKAATEKPTK